jgi:glutamine---fructose-6-phosphate transaminase (isomerizing)
MCGIVGYTGISNCSKFLLSGLKSLEYRGYDSAGIAVMQKDRVILLKTEGKIENLQEKFTKNPIEGIMGIGHTRWATHGKPDNINAHPHKYGKVTVVHNGIVENYKELKSHLISQKHIFTSETDTEIIAHLVDQFISQGHSPLSALWRTSEKIKGTWAFVIMVDGFENTLYCSKNGSPLILGTTENETLLASDIPALLSVTRDMIFLEDGDVACLTKGQIIIYQSEDKIVDRKIERINWNPIMAEKGGFKHFMLKEIFEQPRSIADTLRERIDKDKLNIDLGDFVFNPEQVRRVIIVACGTSYYASLVGKYIIEKTARIPVEVDIASEFRYKDPIIGENDLLIALSQSGETADTIATVKLAKKLGAKVLAISNVLGSQIPRRADWTIYTHAGPEIGVASTKAFTAQLSVMALLGIYMGIVTKNLHDSELSNLIESLMEIPQKINHILRQSSQLNVIARRYSGAKAFLYVGRGVNFPIALEGALKLKEISYIHAEGYPAGEMKHGPIALIDENLPVVAIASKDPYYSKILSTIEEVKSRGGTVIAIGTEGDKILGTMVDDLFLVPETHPLLNPLLTVIPLQFFAYFTADLKGTDVDQPRNLAKSVTVE